MVRARRAKPRRARVVVPVVVALLVVLGAVSVQQGWLGGAGASSAGPAPARAGTQPPGLGTTKGTGSDPSSTTGPSPADSASSSAPSSSAPSSSAPSSSAPSSSAGTADRRRLADCRAGVAAADRVLRAADGGLGRWADDIETQKDAHAGRITASAMVAGFERTRLAGPGDVARYEQAERQYRRQSASCRSTGSTTAGTGTRLATCRRRASAQEPVLAAARAAMTDREAYLDATGRSRPSRAHDVQAGWIRAHPAAAPRILAYQQAANRFDPPAC